MTDNVRLEVQDPLQVEVSVPAAPRAQVEVPPAPAVTASLGGGASFVGPPGPPGPPGGLQGIQGTINQLPPRGTFIGEAWIMAGDLWVWK